MSALPHFSDVDLLGYGKGVIDLNSEIADCTLDLGMAQQELNCSKISRFLEKTTANYWRSSALRRRAMVKVGRELKNARLGGWGARIRT